MSERDMDTVVGQVTAQAHLLGQALADVRDVRGSASSADGRVRAEADAHGGLTGLWLAESISELDARVVSRMITETALEAAHAATRERTRIMTTLHESFGHA